MREWLIIVSCFLVIHTLVLIDINGKLRYIMDEKKTVEQKLIEAVERAEVYRYFNWKSQKLHMVSRNLDAPLTDEEKEAIRAHFDFWMVPFEIVFDN